MNKMAEHTSNQYHDGLAYSPRGMGLEKHTGWGTLLFTNSRACNLSCEGCWTVATPELIRKQLTDGARWLYDGSCGINLLEALLKKFAHEGGRLVAMMSDGEPLIPPNYEFTATLARESGNQALPFLLFTNGLSLDESKLEELARATEGRISYCISMQTGIPDRYGNFMIADRATNHTGEKLFEKLEERFTLWQQYDQQITSETGRHALGVHTYVIPDKTTEEDLQALQRIVERLGNVPWIVSTMSTSVPESMAGRTIGFSSRAVELVKRYHTGPTATLSFGEDRNQQLCSYISHGFYPFEQDRGAFGITFNPYQRGQVQTCPYHSAIGTGEWFNLRDYVDAMRQYGRQITDEHIGRWLDNAVNAETMVTQAVFRLLGYEHCLMRHSQKPEIDLFISLINVAMAKRKREGRFAVNDNTYFRKLRENLEETLKELVPSTIGKTMLT